jgi:hypothetical protein
MYGDMGEDTFFADILCNNQLYIVLGVGGTTYGLFLTSFFVLFDTYMLGKTDIEHIIQQTTKIKNI